MTQLLGRVAAMHDPSDMAGVTYLPHSYFADVIASGSGHADIWNAPAGTYILAVIAQMEDGVDASTVTVGTDGAAEAFIPGSAWTETSDDVYSGSLETTYPNGVYLPNGDVIRVTFGTTVTSGEVRVLIIYYNFDQMAAQGFHFEATV